MGVWQRTSARGERGAAAVEFALVAPLLFLLLLGIISYGYMFSFRQGLSQAAAEGARAAAVAPASADRQDIAESAIEDALGQQCGSTYLVCSISTPATCSADCLEVTLTYRYGDDPSKPEFPGAGVAMPDVLTYSATVEISQ